MKLFVPTALVSAIAVSAAPSLVLDVVGPSSVVDIHSLSVKAILKNTGDETLKLLNDPRTVLSTAMTDTFKISSASGSPAFTGIDVKYIPSFDAGLNEEGTFTVLLPGQSVEIIHDLAGVYDFSSAGEGAYKFGAANVFNYVDATGALRAIKASTNTHKFKLAGRLATGNGDIPTLSKRAVTYRGCTAVQRPQILAAATASNDYVTEVNAYLARVHADIMAPPPNTTSTLSSTTSFPSNTTSTLSSTTSLPSNTASTLSSTTSLPSNTTSTTPNATSTSSNTTSSATPTPTNTVPARYTTWFGNYTVERYNKVVDNFSKIGTDATSTRYDCTACAATRGVRYNSVFAYVNRHTPGRISLCGAFWRAPLTGQDSRAGTIVHENAHFVVNGGASDLAYGHTRAKNLAESNPDDAIRNADSHEYFAENAPALP